MFLAIVIIAMALLPYSANYASVFREYKNIRFYSAPLLPIYSVSKYFGKNHTNPILPSEQMENVAGDARIVHKEKGKQELIILTVGEAALINMSDHGESLGEGGAYPHAQNKK